MSIALIDSHTHLDAKDFDPDREEVIARALQAGVTTLVTIGAGDGLDSAERAIALAEKYDFVYASAGIHPHDAGKELDLRKLENLAAHPKVVAIGETGLDFYRDWAPKDAQQRCFEAQIELARRTGKPLIIHSRDAGEACYETLERCGAKQIGGVFHCFSENGDFSKRLSALNFIISIPGSVTFKKADGLRQAVLETPLERIMLETDAPYLAPEPHRGKRCESALMLETAKMVAKVKHITLEEVARVSSETARRFFRI